MKRPCCTRAAAAASPSTARRIHTRAHRTRKPPVLRRVRIGIVTTRSGHTLCKVHQIGQRAGSGAIQNGTNPHPVHEQRPVRYMSGNRRLHERQPVRPTPGRSPSPSPSAPRRTHRAPAVVPGTRALRATVGRTAIVPTPSGLHPRSAKPCRQLSIRAHPAVRPVTPGTGHERALRHCVPYTTPPRGSRPAALGRR